MTQRRVRRKPGENRARLVKAGLIEFGLHGYYGASTTDIAGRAEVPQPHVYTNFSTKQDLFVACIELAIATLLKDEQRETPGSNQKGLSDSNLSGLIIYQAVSVAQDASLGGEVTPALLTLRTGLGSACFDAILAAAAGTLLALPRD